MDDDEVYSLDCPACTIIMMSNEAPDHVCPWCAGPVYRERDGVGQRMGDLPMWVVYDRPSDYPAHYVARQHVVGIAGQQPTDRAMVSDTLDSIRLALANLGLTCITRSADDDPAIVETWL